MKQINSTQNMPAISHRDGFSLLNDIFMFTEKSVMFHGGPGVGKTDFMRNFGMMMAKKLGLRFSEEIKDIDKEDVFMFITLFLNQMELGEMKGLPYPNAERTRTTLLPWENFPKNPKCQGMFFLDELTNASPSVVKSAYQYMDKMNVGLVRLPKGFRVYAAGNREEDRCDTFELPRAIKNRFGHLQFDSPRAVEWAEDYAIPQDLDMRGVSYVLSHPDKFIMDAKDITDDMFAFPTPRSWKRAILPIKGVEDPKRLADLVGMEVGMPIGMEFAAHVSLGMKYDLPKIFKTRKVQFPEKVDHIYALNSAMISYYKEELTSKSVKEPQKDDAQLALFEIAATFPKEYKVLLLSQAKSIDIALGKTVDNDQLFDRVKKVNPQIYIKTIQDCKGLV